MPCALAVRCNNYGPSVIVMVKVVLKSPLYILVCKIKCLGAVYFIIKSFKFCLPVAWGIYAATGIKYTGLVFYRLIVNALVQPFIGQVLVPGFAIAVNSWVNVKHINAL